MERKYIAIDLKSFYASVECADRGLDPLTTNLVVADESRTSKTICLAVSPSLKAHGIPGRARLFEVIRKVDAANELRRLKAPGHTFSGKSVNDNELKADPSLAVDYVIARPRMSHYIECSTKIYNIYRKYVAPEDMHVYSIDEVFIDATSYLKAYKMTAHELAMTMIREVLKETGITATAGIGTNLYLSKIAMDIVAKHMPADKDGVRVAELDEMGYRRQLWEHRPITDFWRVGRGYARRLEEQGLYTMGDIARCSLGQPGQYYNEELLYRIFGINAELLIDHAWGWEPCTMADIKAYKPESNSIGSGQVLQCPYTADKARVVMREMADALSLDLVDRGLVTDQIIINIGYDATSLTDPTIRAKYKGPVTNDWYGKRVPKMARGTVNLGSKTSSSRVIIDAVSRLYDSIVHPDLLVRRMFITAGRVIPESEVRTEEIYEQLDLFTDYKAIEKKKEAEKAERDREKKVQQALMDIKKKYGKNAIVRGLNMQEGATGMERNAQIGGHKA